MSVQGEIGVDSRLGLTTEDEETRWWRLAVDGDTRAFERLVERHSGRLTSVAGRFLDNREDVADAVQETYLRAWEHRHHFRGGSGVGTWLVAILLNVCRSRRRGHWRWNLFLTRDALRLQPPPDDPRDLAEKRINRGVLERAVAELPTALRVPFTLRFFEEFTGAEIAQILGCRESSVWTRIYTARKRLARQLADAGLE
jgi:RNA polymerase sigma-70 factor (ECF subfamily)